MSSRLWGKYLNDLYMQKCILKRTFSCNMAVANALYVFWAAAKYYGMSAESRDSLIIRDDRCEATAL